MDKAKASGGEEKEAQNKFRAWKDEISCNTFQYCTTVVVNDYCPSRYKVCESALDEPA